MLKYYFTGILSNATARPKWFRAPKVVWFLIDCIFGLLFEEFYLAKKSYKPTARFFKLNEREENTKYKNLTEEEKIVVKKFCAVMEEQDKLILKMIHLESSVQLTFYLTLLLFNVYEVPLLNLNYSDEQLNIAPTKWILGLIWFLVKTILSGFSTFSPILRILKKDSYSYAGSAPSITQYICLTVTVLLDLWFAAGIAFLERSFKSN